MEAAMPFQRHRIRSATMNRRGRSLSSATAARRVVGCKREQRPNGRWRSSEARRCISSRSHSGWCPHRDSGLRSGGGHRARPYGTV